MSFFLRFEVGGGGVWGQEGLYLRSVLVGKEFCN